MDLFGPPTHASLAGKKYCLVIVDDYSRYTWVYFLKPKSDTQRVFIDYANEVQRHHNKTIIAIRSDNGTEFKNYTLNDFLSDEGIKHQYSAAYTPQQNGVAERKNRTLIDAARGSGFILSCCIIETSPRTECIGLRIPSYMAL